MFQKVLLMVILMVSHLYGLNFETIVPFSGSQAPAGTFYKQLPYVQQDMSLIVGFSSIVPGRKTEELDTDLKLGVRMSLPILGESDVYFTFDNHGGVERLNHKDSDFYTQSISLAKTWVYPFTDRMEMGVQAVLGQALANGEYHIVVLPEIYPVLKLKINLF